jgi:hypothetical protein
VDKAKSLMLSDLLAIAAHVLDRVGELPPITVTCAAERFLPPIIITPASLNMGLDEQAAVPRTIAFGLGWPLGRLFDGDGWTSTGIMDDVHVQALAVPLRRAAASTSSVAASPASPRPNTPISCARCTPGPLPCPRIPRPWR